VRARRAAGTAVAAIVTTALTVGVLAGPAAAAPRSPTDSPVQQAQAAADAAVAQISALSAELSAAQQAVADAQARSAIALDEYQAEQAQFEAAQLAAQQAAAAAAQAAADLQVSQDALVAFARRSYMSHSTFDGAAALVTSGTPAVLVERAALLDAAGTNRTEELARFATAHAQADAADAAAQSSLATAGTLQQQAADALTVAQDAERSARQKATEITGEQAQLQQQLDQAQAQLVALVGAQQAAERVARQPAPSSTPSSADPVDRTEAGAGSASAARAAIHAGLTFLGTRYAWGGGGTNGPGYGIDPDAGVFGFDCSGLTQYAYGRAGIHIPRNSRAQFAVLPKVARVDLQPGDLVFWASVPSDPTTIYHVAIYVGGGKVLQAPQSGDVVKVTGIWWTGYAGAVRPSA
jgi:cell wall-associated NlpC family hydrolase